MGHVDGPRVILTDSANFPSDLYVLGTLASARGWELRTVDPDEIVNALADGVFAIVMTLLVFDLGVPLATADRDLGDQLGEMWPEFLMYALSFLVLGVYWLVHNMIFDAIERSDTTLVWLNILYLMFAAFVPFSTALVGEHGAETVTALFYGANLLLLFFMGWSMWTYATSGAPNVGTHIDVALARAGRRMGLAYFGVFAVPLALAFVSPMASMIIYGLIVVAFIGFTVIGRGELVVLWRAGRIGSENRVGPGS